MQNNLNNANQFMKQFPLLNAIATPLKHTTEYIVSTQTNNKKGTELAKELVKINNERNEMQEKFKEAFNGMNYNDKYNLLTNVISYQFNDFNKTNLLGENLEKLSITDQNNGNSLEYKGIEAIKYITKFALENGDGDFEKSANIMQNMLDEIKYQVLTNEKIPTDVPQKGKKVDVRLILEPKMKEKLKTVIPNAVDNGLMQAGAWVVISAMLSGGSFNTPNYGTFDLNGFEKGTYSHNLTKRLLVSGTIDTGVFIAQLLHKLSPVGPIKMLANANELHSTKRKELKTGSLSNIETMLGVMKEKIDNDSELNRIVGENLTLSRTDLETKLDEIIAKIKKQKSEPIYIQNLKKFANDFKKNFGKTYEGTDEHITNYSHLFNNDLFPVLNNALGKDGVGLLIACGLTGVTNGIVTGVKEYSNLNPSKSNVAFVTQTHDQRPLQAKLSEYATNQWNGAKKNVKDFAMQGGNKITSRMILRTAFFDSWYAAIGNTGAAEFIPSTVAALRNTSQNYWRGKIMTALENKKLSEDEKDGVALQRIMEEFLHHKYQNLEENSKLEFTTKNELQEFLRNNNLDGLQTDELLEIINNQIKEDSKMIEKIENNKEIQELKENNASKEEINQTIYELAKEKYQTQHLTNNIKLNLSKGIYDVISTINPLLNNGASSIANGVPNAVKTLKDFASQYDTRRIGDLGIFKKDVNKMYEEIEEKKAEHQKKIEEALQIIENFQKEIKPVVNYVSNTKTDKLLPYVKEYMANTKELASIKVNGYTVCDQSKNQEIKESVVKTQKNVVLFSNTLKENVKKWTHELRILQKSLGEIKKNDNAKSKDAVSDNNQCDAIGSRIGKIASEVKNEIQYFTTLVNIFPHKIFDGNIKTTPAKEVNHNAKNINFEQAIAPLSM